MVNDPMRTMNPFYGIYTEFEKILRTLVIKYTYLSEATETLESRFAGNQYVAAVSGVDTYLSYNDYTPDEFIQVGIAPPLLYSCVGPDGYLKVPEFYRSALLHLRRQRLIDEYVELNGYYRTLNGQPPLHAEPTTYRYLQDEEYRRFGITEKLPVHLIRDECNKLDPGRGDTIVFNLERMGVFERLLQQHPEETYLKYLGSKRVPIDVARRAKNFQIISITKNNFKNSLVKTFLETYDQCRDYFVSAIFVHEYRNFIDHYDNFIGMCIMLMTLQTIVNSQLKDGIRRDYFNDHSLKLLYEAYNIPYDLTIDSTTQRRIAENLNILLQQKATDKVLYNIADILGFKNMKVYKYYLAKVQKEDEFGVPIIKMTDKLNQETGEVEQVPDLQAMYDVFFQRLDLSEKDFPMAFNVPTNQVSYEEVVSADPYWWEDEAMYKQVWETNYQFVESKYLGFGVSYRMTEIMYSNILLMRMLLDKENELSSISFTLPKIDADIKVTLFDSIVLLCCLTAKKNRIRGEIISIPNQVDDVLEYMKSLDNPDDYAVDVFGYNFHLLDESNEAGKTILAEVYAVLNKQSPNDVLKLKSLLSVDVNPYTPNFQKIEDLNKLYSNTKELLKFLDAKMMACTDRYSYETLKRFHRAIFYSTQTKSVYAVSGSDSNWSGRRCAYNFFEYLRYYNPALYNIFFTENWEEQFMAYLDENPDIDPSYTIDDYRLDVESGVITDFYFGTLKDNPNMSTTDDTIYFYISHIISRVQAFIDGLDFFSLTADNNSPIAELLVKLVHFFKSYTVDIVGINTVYITDLRVENMMRMFDEVTLDSKLMPERANLMEIYDYFSSINTGILVEDDSLRPSDFQTLFYDGFYDLIIIDLNELEFSLYDIASTVDATITVSSGHWPSTECLFSDIYYNLAILDLRSDLFFVDRFMDFTSFIKVGTKYESDLTDNLWTIVDDYRYHSDIVLTDKTLRFQEAYYLWYIPEDDEMEIELSYSDSCGMDSTIQVVTPMSFSDITKTISSLLTVKPDHNLYFYDSDSTITEINLSSSLDIADMVFSEFTETRSTLKLGSINLCSFSDTLTTKETLSISSGLSFEEKLFIYYDE